MFRALEAGNHENWQKLGFAMAFEATAKLRAADIGHHQIENDEVDGLALKNIKRRTTGGGFKELVLSGGAEHAFRQAAIDFKRIDE